MGLFGAGAFSPQSFMNASNILDGGGSGEASMMNPHQHQMDQATGLAGRDPNMLRSLFNMIRGHPAGMGGQLPVNIGGQQPMGQMPNNLMNYFGG